jgi:hypothetical protein
MCCTCANMKQWSFIWDHLQVVFHDFSVKSFDSNWNRIWFTSQKKVLSISTCRIHLFGAILNLLIHRCICFNDIWQFYVILLCSPQFILIFCKWMPTQYMSYFKIYLELQFQATLLGSFLRIFSQWFRIQFKLNLVQSCSSLFVLIFWLY